MNELQHSFRPLASPSLHYVEFQKREKEEVAVTQEHIAIFVGIWRWSTSFVLTAFSCVKFNWKACAEGLWFHMLLSRRTKIIYCGKKWRKTLVHSNWHQILLKRSHSYQNQGYLYSKRMRLRKITPFRGKIFYSPNVVITFNAFTRPFCQKHIFVNALKILPSFTINPMLREGMNVL